MGGRRVPIVLVALAASLLACKDFFKVESPVRIPDRELDDPALARL